MRIQVITLFFSLLSLYSYAQKAQNSKTAINFNPSKREESRYKEDIQTNIKLASMRSLVFYLDSLKEQSVMNKPIDSVRIQLKSGTTWNPTGEPPKAKVLLHFKSRKKLDSAERDRLNYLEFISTFNAYGRNEAYKMLDYLYFSKSYVDKALDKRVTIEHYIRPDDEGNLSMDDLEIKVIYSAIEEK